MLLTNVSSASSAGATMRSSTMTVEGEVASVNRRDSFPEPLTIVTIEGKAAGNDDTIVKQRKFSKNIVELHLRGHWAIKCAFLKPGFGLSITCFDVRRSSSHSSDMHTSHAGGGASLVNDDAPLIGLHSDDGGYSGGSLGPLVGHTPFLIEPNGNSKITVTTSMEVIVTAKGVTSNSSIGKGDGMEEATRLAQAIIPPHLRSSVVNSYSSLHRYYDVIHAQKASFAAHAAFVDRAVGFRRGAILDVGCGTGSLAFHLSLAGSPVVAVDPSPAMGQIMAEKATLFGGGAASGAAVRFVSAAIDDADFSLNTVTESGADRVHGFGAIVCIELLSQLSSSAAVRTAMRNLTLHALPGCVLLVSILSLEHYGPLMNTVTQSAAHYSSDRADLAVTAASVAGGSIDVVSRVYVGAPPAGEEGAEVITELTAMALHPRAEKPTLTLTERIVERAYSTAFFESLAEGLGWKVRDVFCSLSGDVQGLKSASGSAGPRRVYLLHRD